MFERRRSYKNLARLYEAELRTAQSAHERSNALAHAFRDAGIGEGDGVAILCRNHRGFIDATVACSKLGAHALYLYSAGGSIKVLGVTLQSAGMNITSGVYPPCFAAQGEFRIQRVRVDQGDVAVTALCNHVVVANSLFTNATNVSGSAAHPGASSLGVYLLTSDELDRDPAQLTVVNSTLVNGMLDVINCCDGVNRIGLYNSVFHRSSGTEISSEAHVVARNNRYDSLVFAGAGLLLGSSGNTSAAPDLNSSFVPNPGSPLIDAGTATVPDGLASTDLAGNERVIGNQVDMGALESPVDGTGTYVVTNTNASGAGSLAAAVDLANADSGPNRIEFDIDGGLCPRRITLSQPLQVYETLSFDGWSQPGSVLNSSENGFNGVPCVVLDGAGTVPIGIETMGQLATDAGRVIVRGLGFEGFSLAISMAFGEDHRVYGNQYVGHVGGVFAGQPKAHEVLGQQHVGAHVHRHAPKAAQLFAFDANMFDPLRVLGLLERSDGLGQRQRNRG